MGERNGLPTDHNSNEFGAQVVEDRNVSGDRWRGGCGSVEIDVEG
jgi:hypothetical protein